MLFQFAPDTQAAKSRVTIQNNERGASMVEYALLVSLIAIVAIGALQKLGNTTTNQYVKITTALGGQVE